MVFENESNYITKEQDQINAMDVQRCYKSEKALIRHVQTRLIEACYKNSFHFKEMLQEVKISSALCAIKHSL